METQAQVSQALESLHAKAARLAWLLEQGHEPHEPGDGARRLALSLLDDIDALRALHLRVVMQTHAPV